MERKASKPVLGSHHHQKTQSGENEAESKRQPKPVERVLLVDKPYQTKKKLKPVEKLIKQPKRGLGVAKLEILRLEDKLKQMSEQLEQLQTEKEITVAAAAEASVPPPPHHHHHHHLPPLLPRPPQHHQQQHHQQFQAPFPPFVDPRQQYPNGMIPVPYGRFVPVGNFPAAAAGAMNKDGPHSQPMNFVFQPMNQNGGYPGPGEPMNVIPNGGIPTGNGAGFIPAGHHHEPNLNLNGNGRGSPTRHHHEPNTNMNGNGGGGGGGGSPAAHHHHQQQHHHHEPNNNIMNGNGGAFPVGGEVNNGGFSNQNIAAGNPYQFLDQQLRIQHLKLMHSARELSAIQRMQYRAPRPSKFSVQMNPIINIEESISKDKMAMNHTDDFLELSLGSKTNIDEQIKKDDDDEKVVEVDPFGAGRRRMSTSSSVVMEYEFFPAESSENRSSSYSGGGGGGGVGGTSEASTSNENTHSVDLSLKLSL